MLSSYKNQNPSFGNLVRARNPDYPITGEKLTYLLVKTNILNKKIDGFQSILEQAECKSRPPEGSFGGSSPIFMHFQAMNIGALRNWNPNTQLGWSNNRLPLTGIGLTISIFNLGYSYIDQANCKDAIASQKVGKL